MSSTFATRLEAPTKVESATALLKEKMSAQGIHPSFVVDDVVDLAEFVAMCYELDLDPEAMEDSDFILLVRQTSPAPWFWCDGCSPDGRGYIRCNDHKDA